MKIGLPRALFYYHYYPLWRTFFESLGHELVISPPTNKLILRKGIEYTVDDACLPVKLFHGHVADLMGKVDAIYVPRIISIASREFICPKFLGLPDMVRGSIQDLPRVIDLELDLYANPLAQWGHFSQLGKALGRGKWEVLRAYLRALIHYYRFRSILRNYKITPPRAFEYMYGSKSVIESNLDNKLYTVLLLGHPYNIYDDYLSLDLIEKLERRGVKVLTYEMMEDKAIEEGAKQLSKKMFWTLGKNILGTAYYFLQRRLVDGIISVASFGCGPDSLVGELLELEVRRNYDTPFLYLNLDEQSGEAGFNTRIEAFLDILEGRAYYEGDLSPYGQPLYTN